MLYVPTEEFPMNTRIAIIAPITKTILLAFFIVSINIFQSRMLYAYMKEGRHIKNNGNIMVCKYGQFLSNTR